MSRTSGSRSFDRSLAARASGFSILSFLRILVSQQPTPSTRHPEVRAKRASKDAARVAAGGGPSPFEARSLRDLAPQGDGLRAALTRARTYHTVAQIKTQGDRI